MEYARDVTVIETMKVSWTEGKAVGFLPMTLFYEEETADEGYKAPVSFFQSFGFRDQPWQSIDEHYLPEATPADIYQYGWDGNPTLDWARLREIRHGRAPTLSLVQDWSSYIGYEDYHAEDEKRRKKEHREFLKQRVSQVCSLCRTNETLYFWKYEFLHKVEIGYRRCPADLLHEDLGTKRLIPPMPSKEAFSQYQVLRSYLERYNKLNSSKRLIRSHSAYRHLVELGREMALFIVDDIKEGRIGGIWSSEVLADLTGNKKDSVWWRSWTMNQEEVELAH